MDEDDQSDSAASDDDEDGSDSGTFVNAYDESHLEAVDVPLSLLCCLRTMVTLLFVCVLSQQPMTRNCCRSREMPRN